MATKPTAVKQRNGNLTKNGRPKYKSLSVAQLEKLLESTSKPKLWAKIMREIYRKDGNTLWSIEGKAGSDGCAVHGSCKNSTEEDEEYAYEGDAHAYEVSCARQ